MNADEIERRFATLAAERRFPASHLARWLALDPASRAAMLDLARALRLRTGQLVHALDTLEEIAVREQLDRRRDSRRAPRFGALANGAGSAPSRASALLERCERFATRC